MTKFAAKFPFPLGGNRHAAGGAHDGLPIDLTNKIDNYVYFNDFVREEDLSNTTTGDQWVWTPTGLGTFTFMDNGSIWATGVSAAEIESVGANSGGDLHMYTGDTVASAQRYIPTAASTATSVASWGVVGGRFAWRDADQTDFFFGVGDISVAMTTGGALGDANYAGFHMVAGDNGDMAFSSRGSSGTAVTQADVFTITADYVGTAGYDNTDEGWVDLAVKVIAPNLAQGFYRQQGGQWNATNVLESATNYSAAPFYMRITAFGAADGDDTYMDYVYLARPRSYYTG